MSATEPIPLKYKVVAALCVPLLLTSMFAGVMAYHEVPAGHVGVETQWSAVEGSVHESGQAWTVPIKEGMWMYDVRPQTYTMSKTQGEGDKASKNDAISFKTLGGIEGTADITIRYRLSDNPNEVKKFAREWKSHQRAQKKLIRPTVRSTFREEAGGVQPDVIMTEQGRNRLESALREALKKQFSSEALVLEAVQVRRVQITDTEYMQALREKKKAQKQLEVEEIQITKEKKIAKQKKIQARADAKVINIKGKALDKNPAVIKLRYIKALKNGNTIYVGSDGVSLTKEVKGNSTDSGN